ncbi:MAG: hypothetical protein WAQ05_11165 [Rubrivivax sp.]
MIRCVVVAAACAAAIAALPVQAQVHRNFPPNALRAELAVATPPEVLLNGQPARLSPGARIRGENNLLQVSSTLAGGRWLVHYTADLTGAVLEVWVLNAAERANQPWPQTAAEAANWTFDPLAQRWSKP